MRIDVKDAFVGYEGKAVQKHLSFSFESGEVCCVLGPNGCGKTTLVKTILGMLPLIEGKITIDGEDVTKWAPGRLAQTIAYVAQHHDQPFPYTVREVVMMGRISRIKTATGQPGREDWHVVENCMKEMNVWHLRDKPYVDISGGELQMVMFARALAQEPELLILDEPTSALDYGNAVRVIRQVRALAEKGYGVLMITHSPDHAFMTGAKVALLTRDKPCLFGGAFEIITRKNIQDAYGIDIKLVEFTHDNQQVMRMCAPVFGGVEQPEDYRPADVGPNPEYGGTPPEKLFEGPDSPEPDYAKMAATGKGMPEIPEMTDFMDGVVQDKSLKQKIPAIACIVIVIIIIALLVIFEPWA